MLFYNTILFMYHRALAPCTHYEDERCKLFIERTPRTILLWQLISLLTSTILSNINHLFVYSYIYAICIFFQTIHLLDVWRHLNKLQSLWSMLEDIYRVSTRWWFSIIIDYWYLFKKYSCYVINTYSFFIADVRLAYTQILSCMMASNLQLWLELRS